MTSELGHSSEFWSPGHRGRQMAKPKGHGKNYYLVLKKEVLAMSTTWIFKSTGNRNGVSD